MALFTRKEKLFYIVYYIPFLFEKTEAKIMKPPDTWFITEREENEKKRNKMEIKSDEGRVKGKKREQEQWKQV